MFSEEDILIHELYISFDRDFVNGFVKDQDVMSKLNLSLSTYLSSEVLQYNKHTPIITKL